MAEHFDVIVLGAGLSGIGAGYHLEASCPDKRYAILEARDSIGGTWDLFRYPGARSDSDMYTRGAFRPWPDARTIAALIAENSAVPRPRHFIPRLGDTPKPALRMIRCVARDN